MGHLGNPGQQFLSGYLEADDNSDSEAESKVIADFSASVQELVAKYHKEYQSLKSATNSLKLVAGPELLDVLQHLDASYDEAFNETTAIMNDFAKLKSVHDSRGLEKLGARAMAGSHSPAIHQQRVLDAMRRELEDI